MYGESLAHRDCRYADQHRHIKPHPPKHAQVCKRKTASAEYQIRIGGGKIWEGRYRGNECSGSRGGGGWAPRVAHGAFRFPVDGSGVGLRQEGSGGKGTVFFEISFVLPFGFPTLFIDALRIPVGQA